jgi:hypothetical protein
VCPLRGCADLDDGEEYRRGRSLIERLAISAEGKVAPTLHLSPSQCADVIFFVRNSEPADPRAWFTEPDEEPSHLVGLCVSLEAGRTGPRRQHTGGSIPMSPEYGVTYLSERSTGYGASEFALHPIEEQPRPVGQKTSLRINETERSGCGLEVLQHDP